MKYSQAKELDTGQRIRAWESIRFTSIGPERVAKRKPREGSPYVYVRRLTRKHPGTFDECGNFSQTQTIWCLEVSDSPDVSAPAYLVPIDACSLIEGAG